MGNSARALKVATDQPSDQQGISLDTFQYLTLIAGGHIFFQTLATSARLGLFTLLSKTPDLDLEEISARLGIASKPARILLLGCAALRLVEVRLGKYRNSSVAETFLVDGKPGNILNIIAWQDRINYRPLGRLYDAVRANANVGLEELPGKEGTLYERLAHAPELEHIFQRAMGEISEMASLDLGRSVDFSKFRNVLDVGGGNASNIINLAQNVPGLAASVFDSPSVCAIANANIARHGLTERLMAVPGDCFFDSFPKSFDCIMFCHFMTIWSEEENQTLLSKAYAALPPGGSVLIFNMMQHNDSTGPLTAAMGSPYFLTLATGKGMLYTWDEYEEWLTRAGFGAIERLSLPRDHGVIIGRKAGEG